jgi:hypothetical protein
MIEKIECEVIVMKRNISDKNRFEHNCDRQSDRLIPWLSRMRVLSCDNPLYPYRIQFMM